MISDRQKLILKVIVEEFVRTNDPVGSNTIINHPHFSLNISSATVRNDMMELEQLGFIEKTHFSSGRIPSEAGYRFYVKEILAERDRSSDRFPMIDEIFRRDFISREQAIKEAMRLVTELTNYTSIVLGSTGYNAKIKRLQFVSLTDRHAVILLVTDKGYVESKKIIIPDDISVRDIERVITVLNEILHETPISKIDETINQNLKETGLKSFVEYYNDLISAFVRIFTEMVQDKYFLSGQSNILNLPEFQNINKVKEFVNAIENQEILKAISVSEDGLTVRIGEDNLIKAMKDCTVITVPYEIANGERGAIAVIGPTRMEYQKIIPLLEYIANNIKRVI
ncbi:MAG: heat-inducible transcriptional repressor HrcA [Bacilli bacterium]|nr:heat-inducible transcriptional repressor HrcA [Bacilli bacterium]